MDIQTCLQVLELPQGASPDQIRRAYKDLVTIWHPDRFANNPRLRQRAEARLKEINQAYETLAIFGSVPPPEGTRRPEEAGSGNVEAFAEMGTRLFLEFCSRLYSAVRRLKDSDMPSGPSETGDPKGRKPKAPS